MEGKQLLYQGKYGEDGNPLPKVKYEDIPEERRKKLLGKHLSKVTQEEFEEWLAVELEFNKVHFRFTLGDDLNEEVEEEMATEEEQRQHAYYYRAEFRHLQEFAVWEKEHLNPLVKELANMAKNDPQYDWHFLYKLERHKLICMEAYLSHSRMADENSIYVGKRWLCLCITLLDYILGYKEVTKAQVKQLNINNVRGLVDEYTLQMFKNATFARKKDAVCDNLFYGKEIYLRKMERLYHNIRLYKTRHWWE